MCIRSGHDISVAGLDLCRIHQGARTVLIHAGAGPTSNNRRVPNIEMDRMAIGLKHAIYLAEQAARAYAAVQGSRPPTVAVCEAARQVFMH